MTWVVDALREAGGTATIVFVAKYIWENHSDDLRASDNDLFYTWQYDMRWAAQRLRDNGTMAPAQTTRRGEWALSDRRRIHPMETR